MQSESNLPGRCATLKWFLSTHPAWGKSCGGCADLLLQNLPLWLPAPNHHRSPRAMLHSYPQLILPFSASTGISFSQRWHVLALAATRPSEAMHLKTLGVTHGSCQSHTPVYRLTGTELTLGEGKMFDLQACLLLY